MFRCGFSLGAGAPRLRGELEDGDGWHECGFQRHVQDQRRACDIADEHPEQWRVIDATIPTGLADVRAPDTRGMGQGYGPPCPCPATSTASLWSATSGGWVAPWDRGSASQVSGIDSVCRFEGAVEAADVSKAAAVRDCGDAAVGEPSAPECVGLAGWCYTQLTDTAQETNGLVDEARVPKIPVERIRAIVEGAYGTRPAEPIFGRVESIGGAEKEEANYSIGHDELLA